MTLGRNVVYLTIEKGVHTLAGLVAMVLVARFLGSGALADYGFAISLTAFFVPVLDLGMNNRMIKSVAGGEDVSRSVEEILSYKLSVTPFVIALMGVGGWFWGGAHLTALVLLVGVSTVAMSVGDGANAVFKGLQRSQLSCLLVSVLNVVLLAGITIALWMEAGLVGIGWAYAISRLTYVVLAFGLLKRVRPEVAFRCRLGLDRVVLWSGFLHLPGIYYLGNLLYLTYLVTYLLSPGDAGVYYVGYRSAAAVYVLVSAGFEAVLANAVSREGRPKGLGMWFVIYSVIALLLLFLAAPLAIPVFGEGFDGSVRPIRLLASCIPPFALCGLGHTLLMAARSERFASGVMGALLAGGLGLAVLAEWQWDPQTTALMPAAASTMAMIILWIGLSRRLKTLG